MRAAGRRFSRFSAVGVIGAGLQLLLMSLLTKCFGLLTVIATPVAVEITLLHNFIWHERFTWSESRAKRSTQVVDRLWRFHAANGLISLGGNTILMHCLVERLRAPTMPAAIGAILLCSAANFLVADRWVYARRGQQCGRGEPI